MDSEERRSASRRTPIMVAVGGLVLAGVVTAGIMAARDTGPAEVDISANETRSQPAPQETPKTDAADRRAQAAAKAAESPPAPRAPQGTGQPISLSGTDPVTGKTVSLASFKGKPVVLAIWASWCHGCNEEAPHLSKVAARRGDVHFVGLNYRDSASGAKDFVTKYGWRFPNIDDASGEKSFGLGLVGTPTTILLDAKHREIGRIVGATDEATFNDAVNRITGS